MNTLLNANGKYFTFEGMFPEKDYALFKIKFFGEQTTKVYFDRTENKWFFSPQNHPQFNVEAELIGKELKSKFPDFFRSNPSSQ